MSCSEAPWHSTLMKCEGTRLCWRFSWNIASAGKMTTTAKYMWNCTVKLSHTALWWWACAHVTDSCQVMQYKQLMWEIFNNPEMFGSQFRNAQISIFWGNAQIGELFTALSPSTVHWLLNNWKILTKTETFT